MRFPVAFVLLLAFAPALSAADPSEGELPSTFASLPQSIRAFVETNLKGCEVLSVRTELKTNAVLARLMSDLYKSRHEYHLELRDIEGDKFKLRIQDSSKIERLDSFKLNTANLPSAVRARLDKIAPGVAWSEVCEAKRENASAVRYELRGRKGNDKLRAVLLQDGTVVSYPGIKDERPQEVEITSPNADLPFVERPLGSQD
jgi:hypothetical protein